MPQGDGSPCGSQVGALRAPTYAGITPDLVAGSSAGALHGTVFATDPGGERIDRLETLLPSPERRRVDGGVAADTPVLQTEALGATTICVPPATVTKQTGRRTHAPVLSAYRAVGQIVDERERRDPAAVRGSVFRLLAATTAVTGLIDFRDPPQLVQTGCRLTQDWLIQQFTALA